MNMNIDMSVTTYITCLEIRETGALAPNGRKTNKPRGLVENLENPLVKQGFGQEHRGKKTNKSYG